MRRLLLLLCPLLLLLGGCGRNTGPDLSRFAPAEEDRLVLYTSHKEELYGPIIREFEARTGIWVQVETGGTSALLERLEAEAEDPACDLLFGGGADSLQACASLFEPYVSPLQEDIQPAFLCPDGTWTAFSSLPVVLIYNPVLIRTNPPDSWDSLLDPAWRGKIAFADPTVSGSGYTALASLLQALPGDDEALLAAFVNNLDGQILESSGQITGAVADGTCYIGAIPEDIALQAVRKGQDVALLCPKEGTCAMPDGMAVIAGCAHGENARRFIDFTLSEDVQQYLAEACFRRSVLTERQGAEDVLPALDYDITWASGQREELLRRWRELTKEAAP